MPGDMSAKLQNLLWWITSIAVSVLCCSVLFVLFASYLVDIKNSLRNNNDRITIVEDREEQILSEVSLIRKHVVLIPSQPPAPVPVPPAPPAEGQPVDASPPVAAPVMPSPSSPPPDAVPAAPPPAVNALPPISPPAMPVPVPVPSSVAPAPVPTPVPAQK